MQRRLQTEGISIVKNYFYHRSSSHDTMYSKISNALITTSTSWSLSQHMLLLTDRLTLTFNISLVHPLLHNRNLKVERGKVGLDQSVQHVREENKAGKCGVYYRYTDRSKDHFWLTVQSILILPRQSNHVVTKQSCSVRYHQFTMPPPSFPLEFLLAVSFHWDSLLTKLA
jgi:hypothetical protein